MHALWSCEASTSSRSVASAAASRCRASIIAPRPHAQRNPAAPSQGPVPYVPQPYYASYSRCSVRPRAVSTAKTETVDVDTSVVFLDERALGTETAGSFWDPSVEFVSSEGGFQTVRGKLRLPVPADVAYALLTDYNASARVYRNIDSSEAVTTAAGDLELIQACRWSFLAFSGSFKIHMSVQEDPQQRCVTFNLLRSSFMRGFRGEWRVLPLQPEEPQSGSASESASVASETVSGSLKTASASASSTSASQLPAGQDGQQQQGQQGQQGQQQEWCMVEHTLSVMPAVPVPPPVSFYMRPIFVRQVTNILDDLRASITKGAASASS